MPEHLYYRSVFLSDVHLGTAGCKTAKVQEFLHRVECDHLYLVGDIIDIWVSLRAGKWRQGHTNIIRTVLGKSKRGCIVRYTPGNHDAFLRKINGSDFGNIYIDHSFVHTTADGKKLLVVHGDFFDKSVSSLKPLAWIGTWIFEGMTVLNIWKQKLTGKQIEGPVGSKTSIKKRFKSFVEYFTNFQERITVDAGNQGYDGVVCGHVHKPMIVSNEQGTLYINTGDWIENCTAIVEHFDGSLELINWDELCETFRSEEMEPIDLLSATSFPVSL